MITDEELSKLQEFVPYAQKHPHASKGYVVGMRRKTARDELDERDVYLSKHQVIEFIQSRAAGVQGVGLTQEAVAEAMKRWPDAQPAIIFIAGAVGALAPITANDIAWANTEIATPHPPKDANGDIVREAIAILRDMPTDRIEYNEQLSALVRKLKPASPKDAGAVPLPKMVGMISDRPICFQDEVARYGNAREAAGRADAVLYEVANNLMLLVEGPGSLRWEDGEGFRLKDTSEWARFYVEVKNAKERTIPHHPPAEPAARAQVGADAYGVHDINDLSRWIKAPHAVVRYRDEVLVAHCTHRDSAEQVASALNGQPNMVMPLDEAIRVGNAMLANAHPSPAHAADIDPWATLIVLCEALGIDIQEARSVPGKPSDVILEAARKKFSEPAHAGAGAEALAVAVEDARSRIGPRRPDDIDCAIAWDRLTQAADILRRLAGGDHA